ncbi:ornithine cyclodeaminase family protein [Propionivibrio soli]|uniref:ornithine cyclodeaminase family protein n=1 Tax=Propionivibrio soli TaxID=2976531 RepID=UPI0021E82B85|nr:ornithine cyclodeaminase family protein [Propionivibrio soli]
MPSDAHLLLLDAPTVEALLDSASALGAVREAFELHSLEAGRTFPIVRERLLSGAVFGIKSGDVPSQGLLGFKAAGFWPANRQRGGEPHQATILLFDPETGRPRCVIDGNVVTTLRTGAAGALGLIYLARPDSARLCVFGTGVQAAVQVDFALQVMDGIKQVRYVASHGGADAAFEKRFADRCDIAPASDLNAAVAESDIVITATPGRGPLFDANAVRPGTHLNCVGADTRGKRELPEGLLSRVRLIVDDRTQASQIGEMQWAPSTPCTELGDFITGKTDLERQATDVTVFDMTGLALQDLTVARLLFERAETSGHGVRVSWPW